MALVDKRPDSANCTLRFYYGKKYQDNTAWGSREMKTRAMNHGSWTLVGLLTLLMFAPQGQVHAQSEELNAAIQSYRELEKEGRYEEAIPFAQELVRLTEGEFGSEHEYLAMTLGKLALLEF